MDVSNVLHMKEGQGHDSYAQNSSLQKKSLDTLKHIIKAAAADVYASLSPDTFAMADLGCSSGPNALLLAGEIVEDIDKRCCTNSRPMPEFIVYLNDLPSNDFNTMFASFPELARRLRRAGGGRPSVFLAGVPGSFYGRLLPSNSLHFITSCYSLHWLSQVPPSLLRDGGKSINKGKIYISHTSPKDVAISYFIQFQNDFGVFLKSRSQEMICGGRIVITMLGRKTKDHSDECTNFLWEVLSQAFSILVSQGVVEEEMVDLYNVPFYAPNLEEIQDEVHKEGSFDIEHIYANEVSTSSGDPTKDGRIISMAIRAIQDSMICQHFGEGIIEALFQNYSFLLSQAMNKNVIKGVQLVVVLKKL